jgi:hypothetical protein
MMRVTWPAGQSKRVRVTRRLAPGMNLTILPGPRTRIRQTELMDIWIMLIEDRHGGPEVLPFSSEARACAEARARAGHDGITQEEMTAGMVTAGWVLRLPVSEEGDRITVIRRTMDAGRPVFGRGAS